MKTQPPRLVVLVQLVERLPLPLSPAQRRCGRPRQYSDQLFLKALVIMLVRRVTTVHGLLQMLAEDTVEVQTLRALLTEGGHFPSRGTWERRLHAIPTTLPEYIACFGVALVRLIQPWCHSGRAVALDSTALRARGGVWHKQHREARIVPHTSIDTEAQWSKSGWHGWWYGWKLHVAGVVASCWIPLAARLTEANVADGKVALSLAASLPSEVRSVLGDHHYQTEELQAYCLQTRRRSRT